MINELHFLFKGFLWAPRKPSLKICAQGCTFRTPESRCAMVGLNSMDQRCHEAQASSCDTTHTVIDLSTANLGHLQSRVSHEGESTALYEWGTTLTLFRYSLQGMRPIIFPGEAVIGTTIRSWSKMLFHAHHYNISPWNLIALRKILTSLPQYYPHHGQSRQTAHD
jgi:hypothetical protein